MFAFAVLLFFFLAQIALAQSGVDVGSGSVELPAIPPDAFVEKGFWETLLNGEFIAKVTPVIIGGQIVLYGLAEGLTRISAAIDSKNLGKVAGWLSEAAWVAGVVIGKFGYSTPKLVVQEKAKEAAKQEPPKGG